MTRSLPPSATRYGQRVDNPPLEYTDTARLRILLQDATQDTLQRQQEINEEVAVRLEKHWGYIRNHEEAKGLAASREEATNLRWAVGILVTALVAVLGWMFHEILTLERVVAACCGGRG